MPRQAKAAARQWTPRDTPRVASPLPAPERPVGATAAGREPSEWLAKVETERVRWYLLAHPLASLPGYWRGYAESPAGDLLQFGPTSTEAALLARIVALEQAGEHWVV